MMAASMPVDSLRGERIWKEIECSICYEVKPLRLLPCQHMLCQDCITELTKPPDDRHKKSYLICPFCQREFNRIPPDGFPPFRFAAAIRDILDIPDPVDTEVDAALDPQCQNCRENVITFRCNSCGLLLCLSCGTFWECRFAQHRIHVLVYPEEAEMSDEQREIFNRGDLLLETEQRDRELQIAQEDSILDFVKKGMGSLANKAQHKLAHTKSIGWNIWTKYTSRSYLFSLLAPHVIGHLWLAVSQRTPHAVARTTNSTVDMTNPVWSHLHNYNFGEGSDWLFQKLK